MPIPLPAPNSKLPRPLTVPVPARPLMLVRLRRDPSNVPAALMPVMTVPVVALSSRPPSLETLPRISGLEGVPPRSAETASGPDKSIVSTPISRHSVSAGPE